MRFMMMVRANEQSEAGELPPKELFAEMARYNNELVKAGVLLAADGLTPSSQGALVSWPGGRPTVTDGPYAEAKELIAGFWIIQVSSLDEAIEWAKRIPFGEGGQVELRRIQELSDFPEDLLSPEDTAREQAWREAQKPLV